MGKLQPHPFFRLVMSSLILLACSSDPTGIRRPLPAGDLRVLFIGNSLTEANDLPSMVQTIAEATGHSLVQSTVTAPNFSLEDHWREGIEKTILAAEADVVVLQQGPSSLPQNQIHLRAWADTLARPIREAGGEPALFQVWPEAARASAFDAVYESYRGAAEAVNGFFLPAGGAWIQAWSRDLSLRLYGPDGFHPTPLGSQVAALTIFRVLVGEDVSDFPNRFEPVSHGLPVLDLGEGARAILEAVEAAVSEAQLVLLHGPNNQIVEIPPPCPTAIDTQVPALVARGVDVRF